MPTTRHYSQPNKNGKWKGDKETNQRTVLDMMRAYSTDLVNSMEKQNRQLVSLFSFIYVNLGMSSDSQNSVMLTLYAS